MSRFQRTSGMTMAVLELARIGLGLAGIFLIMVYGSRAYEAYNSQFWPSTMGEITRSAVDARGDLEGNRRYNSTVKYQYVVEQPTGDDGPFISQRVRLVEWPSVRSQSLAEERLQAYPKGLTVDVYYNPRRPQRSLLEPHFSLAYLVRPLVGMLCLVAAFSLRKVGRP